MEISQLFPDRIKKGKKGNWASCTSCIPYERSKEKVINLKYIDTRISHKVPLVKKTKRGNIVGESNPKGNSSGEHSHSTPLFLNSDQVSIPSVTTYFTSRRIFKKRERERGAWREDWFTTSSASAFSAVTKSRGMVFRIQNLLKMFQNCGLWEKQGSLTGPREMYSTTFSDWYEDEVSNAKSKISFSHFFNIFFFHSEGE